MVKELTIDDKRRCVFVLAVQEINPTTWRRINSPTIDIVDDDDAARFQEPQLSQRDTAGKRVFEIQVYEPSAVDLESEDLLGDFSTAAQRCEDAFRTRFPNACIVDSI